MDITLSIIDRLSMEEFFPTRSSIDMQIMVKAIHERILISDAEKKEINFRIDPSNNKLCIWDNDKVKKNKFSFSAKEIAFLQERIDYIDKKEQAHQGMLDVCLKLRGL